MISLNVDHDSGNGWWFNDLNPKPKHSVIPIVTQEDFIIPIGKCHNLHAQMFHNLIFKTFNNKILPDIFMGYCTESTLTFICAALNKKWVIVKDLVLHHEEKGDGQSSCNGILPEFPNKSGKHAWNHFYGGVDVESIFGTPEARNSGIGYEELCMRSAEYRFKHLDEKYCSEGFCKEPKKLEQFISQNLYLSIDKLDYNYILEEFIS